MQIRKMSELVSPQYLIYDADESAVTSGAINTQGFNSAVASICWSSSMSSAETLTLKVEISDSADNSTYSAFSTLKNAVVRTAGSTATFTGVSSLDIPISAYNQYIKVKITATTSTGTNNIAYTGSLYLLDPTSTPVTLTF